MPGGSTLQRGNIIFEQLIYLPSVTVPTVLANATATQVITVPGIVVGDFIGWNQLTLVAGLAIDNVVATAANQLTFYWSNTTVGSLGPSTTPISLCIARGENVSLNGLTSLPNGIY